MTFSFHTKVFPARFRLTRQAVSPAAAVVRRSSSGRWAAPAAGTVEADAVAGDPAGRRVLFLHDGPGAWWRLLEAVPAGQEWATAPVTSAMAAARLRPLLTVRDGRKPVLVAGMRTLALAVRVAVDCPDAVGGLMLVEDCGGPPAWRRRLSRWFGRQKFGGPAEPEVLAVSDGDLAAIRVPVTLVQGTGSASGMVEALERGLTGCRTLTVVEVPGAASVRPRGQSAELRAALAALVSAVERGGVR